MIPFEIRYSCALANISSFAAQKACAWSISDREIEGEDGQPPREPARADRQELLAFDETDDRAEPDREQAADVHDQQHGSDLIRGPEHDDGQRRHHDRPEDQWLVVSGIRGHRGQGARRQ
jgi:hypothetical protein